tara:strand:+ start:132 stop:353 length:222 start_codon:yes stop_codon:yes gene_type:complete
MDKIHTFAVDKQMRLEVLAYINDFLREEIVNRTLNNQDVEGYYQANAIVKGAFARMDNEFETKVKGEFVNEQY